MKKNREIFLASGEQEDPEKTAEREEKARVRMVEKRERDSELEAILKRMDFGALRKVFENTAKRCGLEPENINFLGPERINSGGFGFGGSYLVYENIIQIAYRDLKKSLEGSESNTELTVVQGLCHEEVHATSKTECHGKGDWWGNPDLMKIETKTGYDRVIDKRNEFAKFMFRALNEGVTEKLSREIFHEYAQTAGLDKDAITAYEKNYIEKPEKIAYSTAVKLVDALIKKISEASGIGREQVWQSLVRGMYEGEDFSDPELREAFAELISPDFLGKLTVAYNEDQAKDLIRDLSPRKAVVKEPAKNSKMLSWLKAMIKKLPKPNLQAEEVKETS